ncbi:MAG: 50S ribosomal protein L10 [Patescibacteria group bacterium]|nr:50S ribosomal protein L10 [Patescibacteria group bacterium]
MAILRARKEEQLTKLEKGLTEAKGIVFSGYRGLTVGQISDFRSQLKKNNADYIVAKKTLIRKACEKIGVTNINNEILDGPVGIAFSYLDEVTAARVSNQFAKKNKALVLMGGIMNGSILSATAVKSLATLPSLNELRAQVLSGFISPIRGFACTLNGVTSNFVRVLSAICTQKS